MKKTSRIFQVVILGADQKERGLWLRECKGAIVRRGLRILKCLV